MTRDATTGGTGGALEPLPWHCYFLWGVAVVALSAVAGIVVAALAATPVACGASLLAALAGAAWFAGGRWPRDRRRAQLAGVLFLLASGAGLFYVLELEAALVGPFSRNVDATLPPVDRAASAYFFKDAGIRPDFREPVSPGDGWPSWTWDVMPLVGPAWQPGQPVHYWAVVHTPFGAPPRRVRSAVRLVGHHARYLATAARAAGRHGLSVAADPVFVEPRPISRRGFALAWLAVGRDMVGWAYLWGAALLLVAAARPTPAVSESADSLAVRESRGAAGRFGAVVAVMAGGICLLQVLRAPWYTRSLEWLIRDLSTITAWLLIGGAGVLLLNAGREVVVEREAGTIAWRRRLLGRTCRTVRWSARDIDSVELRPARFPWRGARLEIRGRRGRRRLHPAGATAPDLRRLAGSVARLLGVPLRESGGAGS